jgi:hypothetical protein
MFEHELTVEKAMDSVSIGKLTRSIDKINVIKAITYLILRLAEHFNMKGKFTSEQASVLALDLTQIFDYETLEDVVLMFKLARQGRIGDGKDFKLDGQTVLHKWVPEYLELKAIERERQHNDKKEDIKRFSTKDFAPEVAKKIFEDVGEAKIEQDKKGGGLGSRYKKTLEKAKVVTTRTEYLAQMRQKAKEVTDKQLKDYLIKNDSQSESFDPQVYEIVETEIDNRLKTKTNE